MLLAALVSLWLLKLVHSIPKLTNSPIVGVVSHPITNHGEYIAASYVKWIESAGGRVVRIPYNGSTEELESLFNSMNAILFPGGSADVSDGAKYLYQLAIDANNNGEYFPIWGTCLGFEWLLQMTGQDNSILDKDLDSMNISSTLNYTSYASNSRMFSFMSQNIFSKLSSAPLTMNNHEKGIHIDSFLNNPILSSFYDVLAYSTDRQGVQYVAAIEAKNYPIFAVQFHPEKNPFEWGTYPDGRPYEVIDHSYEAILSALSFANFFIHEAKLNNHRFESPGKEKQALIYHYHTYSTLWPAFVQVYLFKHEFKTYNW